MNKKRSVNLELHCAGIACSTFAGATEFLFRRHIYVVRWRHFSRSRISLRHQITSRRRFSKTLFPQPNFSPPPNYLAKTLFEDTFPAAEFLPATELPREDAFRRHFSRSRIYARHRIAHRRRFSKTLFSAAEFMPATELSLPRWKRIIPPVLRTSATVRCWKGMINKKRS